MSNQESDSFSPLCPTHNERMVISPSVFERTMLPVTWDSLDCHDCECIVDGCPQHYSPDLGYFILEPNEEQMEVTGSTTIRINRNPKQVICYEHKYAMFLESFDAKTNIENFRCPAKNCGITMTIQAGGAPAYWISEKYFKSL